MKNLLILSLFFCVSISSFSQTSVWKVTKGGNELYLAGTIHLLKPADFPLQQQFYTALAAADVLYVEADVDKMSDPSMAQLMMSSMQLSDGKTLNTVLDEDIYTKLEAECAKLSLPLANLNQFKPSLVVVTLSAMKMMSMGFSTEGVDKHLMAKAKETEKPIKFMESVEFQIDLLSTMGEGNENNFVAYSLKDLDSVEVLVDQMFSDWKSGSSTIMSEQIAEMASDFPQLYHSLLVERNQSWLTKIDALISDDQIELIAVGTLHLHGDDGLIKQLENKGYKVKQLR